MDIYAKFYVATLELIGKLIWPAIILYIVYRFQGELRALMLRIASLKLAGNELVFQPPISNSPPPTREIMEESFNIEPNGFLEISSIRKIVMTSGLIKNNDNILDQLLVFASQSQRTWLVFTDYLIFVLLDDDSTRKSSQIIQKFLNKNAALPLSIEVTNNVGSFKFRADPTWWFYSTALFPQQSDLNRAIANLTK